MKKKLLCLGMTMLMVFSLMVSAFAVEPTATATEQTTTEHIAVSVVYSTNDDIKEILWKGDGYFSDGFTGDGGFKLNSSATVRIIYGFVHENASGTSTVPLYINKQNWLGKWTHYDTIYLTADQTTHQATIGNLPSGTYSFDLNATGILKYGAMTIYTV